jgi:hypothetical protein
MLKYKEHLKKIFLFYLISDETFFRIGLSGPGTIACYDSLTIARYDSLQFLVDSK